MPNASAWFQKIAFEANKSTKEVRIIMAAMNKVIIKELKDTNSSKIPKIVIFKAKKRAAREAGTRKYLGKEVTVSAEPEYVQLRALCTKQFREAVFQ